MENNSEFGLLYLYDDTLWYSSYFLNGAKHSILYPPIELHAEDSMLDDIDENELIFVSATEDSDSDGYDIQQLSTISFGISANTFIQETINSGEFTDIFDNIYNSSLQALNRSSH